MRAIDLFSGIGGFALAGLMTWGNDYEVLSFVEYDKACQDLLKVRFPGVPIHSDVKDFDGTKYTDVDILTGGWPCQPWSIAGKRKGKKDDRALWPAMFRIIKETRPRWVLGENVANIQGMAIDETLSDMESIGYAVGLFEIPAIAVQAPQVGKRIYVVATPNGVGLHPGKIQMDFCLQNDEQAGVAHPVARVFRLAYKILHTKRPPILRVSDGIPSELDKSRIKQLGNAIVPQVAAEIMRAIRAVDALQPRTAPKTD